MIVLWFCDILVSQGQPLFKSWHAIQTVITATFEPNFGVRGHVFPLLLLVKAKMWSKQLSLIKVAVNFWTWSRCQGLVKNLDPVANVIGVCMGVTPPLPRGLLGHVTGVTTMRQLPPRFLRNLLV